jgi:hypothetical protein
MELMDTFPAKIVEWRSSSLFEPEPVDRELERKVLRKLDYTVLPVVAMLYFLSFQVSATRILLIVMPLTAFQKDRTNIGSLFFLGGFRFERHI